MKNLIIIMLFFGSIFAYEEVDQTSSKIDNNKTISNKSSRTELNYNNIQKSIMKNSKETIKIYNFNENKLYKIRLRPLIKTNISLLEGENPIGISIGDKANFQVEILKNKSKIFKMDNIITVMPNLENIDTSLIIYTESGRAYNFYLYSTPLNSNKPPHISVKIQNSKNSKISKIEYKNKYFNTKFLLKEINRLENEKKSDVNFKKFNIGNLNFDYEFDKTKNKYLKIITSDSQYTYFKFSKDYSIPSIFYYDNTQDIFVEAISTVYKNVIKVKKLSKFWILKTKDESYFNNNLSITETRIKKINSIYVQKVNPKLYKEFFIDFTEVKNDYVFCKDTNLKNIKIEAIFNDADFLYLKFNLDNGNQLPVVYNVIDDIDNPINTEVINSFLIAKGLRDKISMTLGKQVICLERVKTK